MTDLPWEEMDRLEFGKSRPTPYYDSEADTLTLFIADKEYERERVDRYLTVYRAVESGAVIGCHIKDVAGSLLENVEALHLGIAAQNVTLSLLLSTMPVVTGDEISSRVYREICEPLSKFAEKVRIPDLIGV